MQKLNQVLELPHQPFQPPVFLNHQLERSFRLRVVQAREVLEAARSFPTSNLAAVSLTAVLCLAR